MMDHLVAIIEFPFTYIGAISPYEEGSILILSIENNYSAMTTRITFRYDCLESLEKFINNLINKKGGEKNDE